MLKERVENAAWSGFAVTDDGAEGGGRGESRSYLAL